MTNDINGWVEALEAAIQDVDPYACQYCDGHGYDCEECPTKYSWKNLVYCFENLKKVVG